MALLLSVCQGVLTFACNNERTSYPFPKLELPLDSHIQDSGVESVPQYSYSDVKATIINFHLALNQKNGALASELVTSDSILFFEEVRQVAARRAFREIQDAPFWKRYFTVLFSHTIPVAFLTSLKGIEFFQYLVRTGYLSSESNQPVKPIALQKQSSRSYYVLVEISEVKWPDYVVHLIVERNKLRYDLLSFFKLLERLGNVDFSQVASEKGLSVNEYLLEMIEQKTGKKIGPRLRTEFLRNGGHHHRREMNP